MSRWVPALGVVVVASAGIGFLSSGRAPHPRPAAAPTSMPVVFVPSIFPRGQAIERQMAPGGTVPPVVQPGSQLLP